ncbi:hypothetical protein LZ575_16550 [Antarcticibacterium sp. 1MA-6-2]|uniref:hypothetical protein n=1 Tax=Antarcticibacterium sp. 1MA-6-2 TaxID=2908210 RepID=UPI001F3CA9EF|nr:hypothetical protein [Antarcticibacterium sp. 1MA-6-2]UJH90425.1 hypothetical protein LZ575_16550 [Antarcticibacterium sp. 1MA-6-2]
MLSPRINGVAGRLSRQQILEALINPGKELSPGFGMVSIDLKNGQSVSGILQGENDITIAVKRGNVGDTVIRKEDVLKRTNSPSSMPNMSQLLTKREIRDLVSYLATLKEDEMVRQQEAKTNVHGE